MIPQCLRTARKTTGQSLCGFQIKALHRMQFVYEMLERHKTLSSQDIADLMNTARIEDYGIWSTADVNQILDGLRRRDLIKSKRVGKRIFYFLKRGQK